MPCYLGKNSITCYRGQQKKYNGKVKDRQGNIWFVEISKKEFDKDTEIEVFNENGKVRKKFMRQYLIWIESL